MKISDIKLGTKYYALIRGDEVDIVVPVAFDDANNRIIAKVGHYDLMYLFKEDDFLAVVEPIKHWSWR